MKVSSATKKNAGKGFIEDDYGKMIFDPATGKKVASFGVSYGFEKNGVWIGIGNKTLKKMPRKKLIKDVSKFLTLLD